MIIYRLTDRIPVKVGGLTFWLSPLSYEQKTNLLDCKKMQAGVEVADGGQRARLALKYAVKGVDGLKCSDGSPYAPVMDADGTLSMESVDELTGLDACLPLVRVCVGLINGVSDPGVEGAEVKLSEVVDGRKKD